MIMNNKTIIGLAHFSFGCIFSYFFYKFIYLRDQTISNPYTKSDTLKSLIIGNLLSILATTIFLNTPKDYLQPLLNPLVITGANFLFTLATFISGRYGAKGTNGIVFTSNTFNGFFATTLIAISADLHSSVLFLSVLSLQYITVATGWSFTRKFAKFALFMTLARALTTILYSDLVQVVYMLAQMADYLLDIVSYYVVYTITLGYWIKYSFFKMKEVQNLSELLVIVIKE